MLKEQDPITTLANRIDARLHDVAAPPRTRIIAQVIKDYLGQERLMVLAAREADSC